MICPRWMMVNCDGECQLATDNLMTPRQFWPAMHCKRSHFKCLRKNTLPAPLPLVAENWRLGPGQPGWSVDKRWTYPGKIVKMGGSAIWNRSTPRKQVQYFGPVCEWAGGSRKERPKVARIPPQWPP